LVTRNDARGLTVSENVHASAERSDWSVSMDQLQEVCPNLQSASLVVPWYGDDLRCGECKVRPRVDNASKITTGATWLVSGETRADAVVVSNFDGTPAYGGTPSDETVVRAIQDLQARGLDVTFYPFLLMDITVGNGLPDPYGGVEQQAYPWRGNITCGVASGRSGTPDKTPAVASQLNRFMGSCTASQFTVLGTAVAYAGPVEWSYRRMILHYAKLCAAAGGVQVFLIGSELRGLTRLRSTATTFSMVEMLRLLAADVKAILPTAKVSYAADWSEYFGYHPQDGSGDVFFNLDPLWADAAIDFVGIDNYMPLADWRDGHTHLDAQAGAEFDQAYLSSRIASGEGFDWFYASQAARDMQTRTTISDGAYGKPWVFRYKDVLSWWSNPHRNRPNGIETVSATAWVPQSKPIWFTEAGCPAVDKGANQPNVFYDPKSAESAFPYYSGGQRDDVMQHNFVAAMENYWSAAGAHNPISSVYGATMVQAERTAWWAWDARPFPAFPARTDVWSDGANYARGHWLNGRLGAVDLGELISSIVQRFGLGVVDASAVSGLIDGFVLDRPMSGRDALENLLRSFALDAVESDGVLKIKTRNSRATESISRDDLVESGRERSTLQETRAQETDLPRVVRLAYIESALDYRTATVQQTQTDTASSLEIIMQLPAAVPQSLAQARVDVALAESWGQRTTAQFTLLPSCLALEPGDVVTVDGKTYRLSAIMDAEARGVEALQHDASVYDAPALVERLALPKLADVFGKPDVLMLDLAVVATAQPAAPWLAAQAKPWPGRLSVLRQQGGASFVLNTLVGAQATMGETLNAMPSGIVGRVDYSNSINVKLDFGALSSVSRLELLAGANTAAIGDAVSGYEIIQFETADLIANNTYRLHGLLRAQAGSFAEMSVVRALGQRFVLLNGAVSQAVVSLPEAGLPSTWRVGPASLDHGHAAYVQISVPPTIKALRPLRPAQLRSSPVAEGVLLTWIRQTRSGGDAWEFENVPLSEDVEAYVLQVLGGATVLRSWTPSSAQQIYTTEEMTQDFGAPTATLSLKVAQVSAAFGAGTFLEGIVNV
jgi:GTA TIM-barrel-like domain/Putative phage tail protein